MKDYVRINKPVYQWHPRVGHEHTYCAPDYWTLSYRDAFNALLDCPLCGYKKCISLQFVEEISYHELVASLRTKS